MIEHDDDPVGVEHLLAAHLAQKISRARSAAIVEHDIVGRDIDDLADFDALAVCVLGNDFGNGVHACVPR